MMKKLILIVLSIGMVGIVEISAQIKLEREYRISSDEAPVSAREFVDQFSFERKIKWYREENLSSSTIEAKTKYDGQRYSIEFDTLGQIEDVEVTSSIKNLPEKTQHEIYEYLENSYNRYKIEKVQVQYSSPASTATGNPWILPLGAPLVVRYELEINARINRRFQRRELLFSEEGELLRERTIIRRNTDNLEY